MLTYIEGTVEELAPDHVVVGVGGLGYFINISLSTYPALQKDKPFRLLVHEIIREDAHLLFGFASRKERDVFRALISVSGVGANTARMMLSSMAPKDIEQAILTGDVAALKNVKGIGAKSAQRIIVELKDKLGKGELAEDFFQTQNNTIQNEALSALVALGFAKNSVEKVLRKVLAEHKNASVEEVIKVALKNL
ncbi:MAG: Holliday junction branch migration protein RuvA [Bacteroidota bacterium]